MGHGRGMEKPQRGGTQGGKRYARGVARVGSESYKK